MVLVGINPNKYCDRGSSLEVHNDCYLVPWGSTQAPNKPSGLKGFHLKVSSLSLGYLVSPHPYDMVQTACCQVKTL